MEYATDPVCSFHPMPDTAAFDAIMYRMHPANWACD